MSLMGNLGDSLTAVAHAQPQLKKLKQASQQIESMFLKDLLTQMQKGTGKSLFGSGPGSDIYQDMFTQAVADAVSQSGSFGIASTLTKQFTKDVVNVEVQKVREELQKTKAAAADSTTDLSTVQKGNNQT